MKSILLTATLLLLLGSCKQYEHINPFDSTCPKEFWTPANFKAALEGTTVKLTWTQPVTMISGFKITKKVGDAAESALSSPGKDILQLSDNDLIGGKLHTYTILATAGNNQSNSVTVQITPTFMATVTTTLATSVLATSAILGGNITNDGGATITKRGICWAITTNPTTANDTVIVGTGTGTFSKTITALLPAKLYYFRAYAINSQGTAYGNEITATTLAVLPVIATTVPSGITASTIASGGNITSDGGAAVTARGICWGIAQNPTIDNSKNLVGTGTGSFASTISGLNPGTTYFIRAFATNSIGTVYGNEVTAKTLSTIPVLTTTAISAITSTTATSGGNITSDGGAAVTVRGICWSTSQNPTIADPKTSTGTGSGSFTSNLTGLTAGATYYVRAYATNSMGTAYGNELTLTTVATLPTLTTTAVSALTSTTAASGGTITNDGGSLVTARGVCFSTSQNPTIADSKTSNETGAGSFVSSITGLTPGMTYYIRAYATNGVGTAYGNELTCTTTATLPTITTTAISAITSTSATSGGNITNDGGSGIIARGVCWSTSQNPTIADSKTSDNSGSGSFTSSVTALAYATTYYVRAYATNGVGTAYGNELTITTLATLPTITTTAISAVTSTTATSGGVITNDGGSAVTARGVCWSTSQNPTIADSRTTDGTGKGTFTSSISGLTSGTTYFLRAYAINSVPISYGSEFSFTPGTVMDIDGNVYHYINIGTQVWMVENMKTTKYRNGDPISNVTDNGSWIALITGAYCWYNNDAPTYKATYGALYNWYAAADSRNIAPVGWHIPTDVEWTTLTTFLGGESFAGGKLKESGTAHWTTPNTDATNSSMFTALPSGSRFHQDGKFYDVGSHFYCWSNTSIDGADSWFRYLYYNFSNVVRYNYDKQNGLSIRCVRD